MAAFGLLFLSSCNEDVEPKPSFLGYDYYPLQVGSYRVYDINERRLLPNKDSVSRYKVIEMLSDKFEEGGDTIYRIERFYKYDSSDNWSLDSVWTTSRTPDLARRTENQVPYIKLSFPVEQGKTWDGNRANTRPSDEYRIDSLEYPFQLDDTTFNNTLTVVQGDQVDLISTDLRWEVYAKGLGLVYKFNKVLEHQNLSQQDTTGLILKQKLIDYGP